MVKNSEIAVVYFGSRESIRDGGDMHHLQVLAENDQRVYKSEAMRYFANSEPECKERFGFEPDLPALVLLVHEKIEPYKLQMSAEHLSDPNAINLWISTNFVLFTM